MEARSHLCATPCAHQLCVYYVSWSLLYPGIVYLNNPQIFFLKHTGDLCSFVIREKRDNQPNTEANASPH